MREYVRAENEPEAPEIGYFNTEEHVWQIAPAFYGYQQLPEAGGLNDQFADEWDDIKTWIRLHDYCQWEYNLERYGEDGRTPSTPKRDITDMLFNRDGTVSDWQNVIGND